jgi:selenocysteine-specific elongation factor
VAPGEAGFAQVRLERPVVALNGERFIVRSYSPAETVAGGLILDPAATKHRGKELAKTHERLRALMDARPSKRLAAFVEASADHGLRRPDLSARTGWTENVLSEMAARAREEDAIVEADGVFIARENFERFAREAVGAVKEHHKREPLSRGLARETLREQSFAGAEPEVFRAVIARLESEGELVAEKDLLHSPEHSRTLSPEDAQLREKIAASYEQAGLETPTIEVAFEQAGVLPARRAHGRKILQLLIDDGTLVRVQGEMFLHARALTQLKERLSQYASEHEPDRLIDVAAFKDLAGVSRKYAIPFLEYLDSERITRRAGDKRIIIK